MFQAKGVCYPSAIVSGLILALVFLTCSDPTTGPDASQVQVSLNHVYYYVSGSTVDELRAQMDEQGYTDASGHHWDAYTDWHVSWSYPYSITNDECAIGPVQVNVAITFTFPTWKAPEGTRPEVVDKWDDYIASLETHENGHKEIAIAAAHAVVDALETLPTYPSCSKLELAADDAVQKVLQQHSQQETIYDRTTEHGATQGASFP